MLCSQKTKVSKSIFFFFLNRLSKARERTLTRNWIAQHLVLGCLAFRTLRHKCLFLSSPSLCSCVVAADGEGVTEGGMATPLPRPPVVTCLGSFDPKVLMCGWKLGKGSPRELFPIATSLLTCCWSSMLLYRHCNYSLFFIYVLSYSHTQLPMGNKHSSCKHLIRFIVLIMSFLFMCSCAVDWKLPLMLVVWLSGYWFHFYVFYKRNCLSVCSHR